VQLFAKYMYNYNDKDKEDEMGETYSKHEEKRNAY
jgi:hypothetical protein